MIPAEHGVRVYRVARAVCVCVEPGNWATYNLSDYLMLFTKWEK